MSRLTISENLQRIAEAAADVQRDLAREFPIGSYVCANEGEGVVADHFVGTLGAFGMLSAYVHVRHSGGRLVTVDYRNVRRLA